MSTVNGFHGVTELIAVEPNWPRFKNRFPFVSIVNAKVCIAIKNLCFDNSFIYTVCKAPHCTKNALSTNYTNLIGTGFLRSGRSEF